MLTLDGHGERLDIPEREKNTLKMASMTVSGTATQMDQRLFFDEISWERSSFVVCWVIKNMSSIFTMLNLRCLEPPIQNSCTDPVLKAKDNFC